MPTYKDLLAFLENRAGEATRGVAEYTKDELKLLYIRQDLENDTFRSRVNESLLQARSRQPLLADQSALGDRKADVEVYENAVLVHLPLSKSTGLIASFEPEIAIRLTDFIDECYEAIESSSNT